MRTEGPVFCQVEIRPEHRVTPQVRFGRPNEDAEPLLPRREFMENMLVKPLESSAFSTVPAPHFAVSPVTTSLEVPS